MTVPFQIANAIQRKHVSKHRQFDEDGKRIEGAVRIGSHSGLRKLMRAANRGKVPSERLFVIVNAMKSAERPERRLAHMSAHQRRRHLAPWAAA